MDPASVLQAWISPVSINVEIPVAEYCYVPLMSLVILCGVQSVTLNPDSTRVLVDPLFIIR